jgi:DNA-directed RNA polymerase specialized sigma24 family protein
MGVHGRYRAACRTHGRRGLWQTEGDSGSAALTSQASRPDGGAERDEILHEVANQEQLLRCVLHKYGAPAALMDDLVQETFVIACRHVHQGSFCPPDHTKPLTDSVAAWISGIAKHVAMDGRRALVRHLQVFGSSQTKDHPIDTSAIDVADIERRLIAKEQLARIAQLKLTAKQRDVLILTGLGHTAPEIGAMLGIPHNTASTCLRGARAAYRWALGRPK